jgi:hypothetical protein
MLRTLLNATRCLHGHAADQTSDGSDGSDDVMDKVAASPEGGTVHGATFSMDQGRVGSSLVLPDGPFLCSRASMRSSLLMVMLLQLMLPHRLHVMNG